MDTQQRPTRPATVKPPLRRGYGGHFCHGCAKTRATADMRYFDHDKGEWVVMTHCKTCQGSRARSLV